MFGLRRACVFLQAGRLAETSTFQCPLFLRKILRKRLPKIASFHQYSAGEWTGREM